MLRISTLHMQKMTKHSDASHSLWKPTASGLSFGKLLQVLIPQAWLREAEATGTFACVHLRLAQWLVHNHSGTSHCRSRFNYGNRKERAWLHNTTVCTYQHFRLYKTNNIPFFWLVFFSNKKSLPSSIAEMIYAWDVNKMMKMRIR